MASKSASAASSGFNAKQYVRVGVSEEEVNDIKLAFDFLGSRRVLILITFEAPTNNFSKAP